VQRLVKLTNCCCLRIRGAIDTVLTLFQWQVNQQVHNLAGRVMIVNLTPPVIEHLAANLEVLFSNGKPLLMSSFKAFKRLS
jgi:hypothetical protein